MYTHVPHETTAIKLHNEHIISKLVHVQLSIIKLIKIIWCIRIHNCHPRYKCAFKTQIHYRSLHQYLIKLHCHLSFKAQPNHTIIHQHKTSQITWKHFFYCLTCSVFKPYFLTGEVKA